ncbi:uncharacterized protein [Arachis hypogaea]|uniref:uncharacterized protein n=1 Tax=Arachis hypogaea TaxID=3818 RepID=UPI003B213E93
MRIAVKLQMDVHEVSMFPSDRTSDTGRSKGIVERILELYNKVSKVVQALQSCYPKTISELKAVPYYDRNLLVRDCGMFDKVFWAFPSCVKAFKHFKPFVFIDEMHLYGRYGGVLLIVVAQDDNNNILPIAFVIVEFESTESWSFFLTNLRQHVTLQEGLLIISDRS